MAIKGQAWRGSKERGGIGEPMRHGTATGFKASSSVSLQQEIVLTIVM